MNFVTLQVPASRPFKNTETRRMFASAVSSVIEAGRGIGNFEPYKTSNDDLGWAVNSGNDWWVFFDRDDHTKVQIRHRYGSDAINHLAGWIAYVWGAKIV